MADRRQENRTTPPEANDFRRRSFLFGRLQPARGGFVQQDGAVGMELQDARRNFGRDGAFERFGGDFGLVRAVDDEHNAARA